MLIVVHEVLGREGYKGMALMTLNHYQRTAIPAITNLKQQSLEIMTSMIRATQSRMVVRLATYFLNIEQKVVPLIGPKRPEKTDLLYTNTSVWYRSRGPWPRDNFRLGMQIISTLTGWLLCHLANTPGHPNSLKTREYPPFLCQISIFRAACTASRVVKSESENYSTYNSVAQPSI
jgi:hypothetical protein